MAIKKQVVDFTNTKDAPDVRPKRVPAGDYELKITKVVETITKENKDVMWTFIVVPTEHSSAAYPYRCILTPNSLWKLRNLLVACGKTVPKKKVNVDPEKLIGAIIGGTLEDAEYEGREQSEVTSVFPAEELEDSDGTGDDSPADDDDVADEELEEMEVDDL